MGSDNFKIVFPLFLQRNHSLQFHKKNTHADKNKLDFQCEKCGFATYAKRYLQSHLRKVHRGNEKYKHICEHCGEGFLYPFDLNKHHVIISLLKKPNFNKFKWHHGYRIFQPRSFQLPASTLDF